MEVSILMAAIPHDDASDATLYSLRQAVVTVISPFASSTTAPQRSEIQLYRMHLARPKQWAQGLALQDHGVSYHVLEPPDVAQALVRYAQSNHVGLMIVGAATHGLHWQRWIATIPMRVVRDAPCSVMLVKQQLPFSTLHDAELTVKDRQHRSQKSHME